jgi:hypothetical protein
MASALLIVHGLVAIVLLGAIRHRADKLPPPRDRDTPA